VGASLLLTLTPSITGAIEPLFMKQAIDVLTEGGGLRQLVIAIIGLFAIAASRELLMTITNWLKWRTRLRVHLELLGATVERLHARPVSDQRNGGVGAEMTLLERGIQGFLNAISELAFQVFPAVVYLVMAGVLMFQMDWRLSLVALVFAPLPALIAMWAAPEQTERERFLLDAWGKIYARFNEVLSALPTVRSFTMEQAETKRFLTSVDTANKRLLRGVARDSKVGGVQGLVISLARIAAMGVGAMLILEGQSTVGTLVAFLAYLGGLFAPITALTGVYTTAQRARASVDHIYSILDAKDELADSPDSRELVHVKGEVVFEGVSFSYAAGQTPTLSEVDLHVRPGERVAIVGPSGAGKSTLMALLQRFHDPQFGHIRIDGCDLRALTQQSVRSNIGVVLQESVLFDDSVRANIAYGRPHASEREIMAAAQAANAHDFIQALPGGYDAPVGERGRLLSGGERQRIAIARALLKDPRILILDEATSALDAESQVQVQQALERLVQGRTTFIIAHRLATVVNVDRIIVMKNGRIHEMGNHAELMDASGYYAQLVRQHMGGMGGVLGATQRGSKPPGTPDRWVS
jgi:ATP-binding cassette, subfamily B, bacterial